ncbi:MAG TPA: helix-turn-helix domain-containing protein [Mycobacterium sp.]|nr:helix-turn-helix domain-containing protein [Mycobacterium sp.]
MQQSAPAVKRRPKDRKEQILEQAVRLFTDRGFHSVKLEDIAESAGVTARALYRHYENKQALLAAVIRTAQENYLHARDPDGPRGDAPARPLDAELPDLISAAIATRALTVLWQREARYLNEADRADVRDRINTIVAGMEASVRLEFPDLGPRHSELRAWAVSSTMTSLGRHNLTLPRDDLTALLRGACTAAARTPVVGGLQPIGGSPDSAGALFSRHETLLAAGARLFRTQGFPAVSTTDIGKKVGIAGPGLYRSFSSKQAILDTLLTRFDEWSALECLRVARIDAEVAERLRGLVAGRVRISLENPDLVAVSITELPYASAEIRDVFVRNQSDRDALWVDLLRKTIPETGAAEARLLVAAAVSFIEDVARTWHLTQRTGVAEEMTAIAMSILTSQAARD